MKNIRLTCLPVLAFAAVLAAGAQNFTVVHQLDPESLDPQTVESLQECRICSALYEGLMVPDPRTGAALPGLAEAWSFSPDNRTVTFTLREAFWSDGVPITAETVVRSWIRKMDPKNAFPFADLPGLAIEGGLAYLSGKAGPEAVRLRAVSERILEVGLSAPMPQFPQMALHSSFSVVPMHLVEKYGASWASPETAVFNGPFVLREWSPGDKIVLEKNRKYWDAKAVALKTITFMSSKDAAVTYNLFRSGAADWIDSFTLEQYAAARKRSDFHESPAYGVYYYFFNLDKVPYDDRRVRLALSMSLDKSKIAALAQGGGRTEAVSFVPPSEGYSPAPAPSFDPAAARALLAEAGFPEGRNFPAVTLLFNANSVNRGVAESMRDQWKANLGISVVLKERSWNDYIEARAVTHEFSLARGAWAADYLDPSVFSDIWRTGSIRNDGGFSDPRYDSHLADAGARSGAARMESLAAAEKVLLEEAAVLPLFFYTSRNLIDLSRWAGWYPNPLDQHPWKFIAPRAP